ncbi:septation ring formation regulator [Cytobacillus eiseniae]|uniref:Septation ring formation regulator EzrA n=1 Tax=Cytobacillus eiseniae TaxID=762947 RepID=A0ABS4RET4_9BACI|nr:septation ring formation regulator [Cytobacillus eiseniae]
MEWIIGIIVILIGLFLTGFILKKKYYKEVDRLEAWKMDIVNRPVLDEMSKVKQLNMTGQTEELFERWRSEWDDIVTAQLPNVEERLFDAEEFIDKYLFNKAKKVQQDIGTYLTEIEDKIKKLLNELNDLVGSEEKNRTEVEELKDLFRENKKTLLAHRHTYGKAADLLEEQLDLTFAKVDDFNEKTNSGNYLEAREIILIMKGEIELITEKMEMIPSLMVECLSKIPVQIKELKDGYKDMQEQGFILDHIQFEKETARLEEEVTKFTILVEQTEITEVQKGITEIKDSIELLYDLLEEEVNAKHYIIKQDDSIRNILFTNREINKQIRDELEIVQQSYHVSEHDMDVQPKLDKKLTQLFSRFEVLEHKINSQNIAYSLLKEELVGIKEQLESIEDEHTLLAEKLQMLRKDEMTAREKVKELRKRLAETTRLISKSNVPGLPEDYKYLIQDAKESIENVVAKLEEQPLNIQYIQQYLEVSVLTVDKLVNTTEDMIETIILVERVIQYGNRYRSRYPSVEKGLLKAETAFRGYDYKTALEQAATSIEEVDPGAINKIEDFIKRQ